MPNILIIEDEPQMAQALKDNFELEEYDVTLANNGESGLQEILKGCYHLVILDVMLPKMSGLDVCKTARQKHIDTPIIMLTAKVEEYDKVLGLEYGADDYVTKPFSLIELLARVRAVLRRGISLKADVLPQSPVAIGKLQIDFGNYEAFTGEIPIKMSHTEIEILKHLWLHKHETVKREEILKQVYGIDSDITSRTIDNFIVRLRQKIETDAANPRIILTVHGLGYKLID